MDPCLWEAAKIPNFIETFYENYPKPPAQRNIIRDIMMRYFDTTYECSITDIQGCPLDFQLPSSGDSEKIVAWLAFIAVRRHMLFMRGTYNFMSVVFNDVISTDVSVILAEFTGLGVKPAPAPADSQVADGMAVASAVVGLLAAFATDGLSQVAWGACELLSLGATVASVQDDWGPNPQPIAELPKYLRSVSDSMQAMIEQAAFNFTSNMSFASILLDTTLRGASLNLTEIPLWSNPALSKPRAKEILQAWSISRVMKALNLFVHWEDGCDRNTMVSNGYPGQECVQFAPDPKVPKNETKFTFPVLYWQGTEWATPNLARRYDAALHLANWNLTWGEIAAQSARCQFNHFDPATQKFNHNSLPTLELDALANAIAADPTISVSNITCLWNIPVCDATTDRFVGQCTNMQRQCTGHKYPTLDNEPFHSSPQLNEYDDDNFGFDDWCARQLGIPGLSCSPAWSSCENPFQDR